MAKKKKVARILKPLNKSRAIRDYAAKHRKAMPKEIAAALTKQHGVEFSNSQVSVVLYQAAKSGKVKPAAKKARTPARKTTKAAAGSNLKQAANFAGRVGGLVKAEALLAKLRRIKEIL